jgi:hypothetical protein
MDTELKTGKLSFWIIANINYIQRIDHRIIYAFTVKYLLGVTIAFCPGRLFFYDIFDIPN